MGVRTKHDGLIEQVEATRGRLAALRRRDLADEPLPEWTWLPLRMAGMSAVELERLRVGACAEPGLRAEIRRLEDALAAAEDELLARPHPDAATVRTLIELALDRVRERLPADHRSVFQDNPEARVERLLARAATSLANG
jgi:hypothetical protein